MLKHVSCFIAAALASPAFAQPVATAPWMTAERLLRQHEGTGRDLITEGHGKFSRDDLVELHDRRERAAADAYVDGVHDATEGKRWCYATARPKPAVIRDAAWTYLRALPPDQRKGNAADLLVADWAQKWPCGGK